jgi:uncharacterized protein
MESAAPQHRFTNGLAGATSPYLLQHAHNPVNWLPWGDAAFAKARAEGKPIFLSIGYSTCHWCHVMERESFEDETTAKVLNEHFVSIKVDREERPDVDKIYMTFVQSTTGGGGWPLSVFLTPGLKPFYGGTYFPPEPRYGRPSFRQLLEKIGELWREKRSELESSASDLGERLNGILSREPGHGYPAGERELHGAGETFLTGFDHRHGGFGDAPKFPRPSMPLYLLRFARRFSQKEAVEAVLKTCTSMAAGGIHDQLGGGFARYSVDAKWLVPHFEKMLYDQAQLLNLYLDAWLVGGDAAHAAAARGICGYVLRDMTHSDGGFFSAEDADSEGQEGKFYCWTMAELKALLTKDELAVVSRRFGITEKGNFVDESHPHPLHGLNVLSLAGSPPTGPEAAHFESAKSKMTTARAGRIRPHLDDKILASWNGMMIGAMARAGVILSEPRFLAAAERAADFLATHLWDSSGKRLASAWREGRRQDVELLDAYANTLSGVVDLYECALNPKWLEWAVALAEAMVARFSDPEHGGFWQTAADAPHLLCRVKEDYDGAEPSGNSVASLALLRLGAICDRKDWLDLGEKSIRFFAQTLHQTPHAAPHLMMALDFASQAPKRVVIAGDWRSAEASALVKAAHGTFEPHRVLLGVEGPVEPFARTLPVEADGVRAYCCTGSACQAPVREPEKVRAFLAARESAVE